MKVALKENPENELLTLQSVIDVNTSLNAILKESYRNLSGKKHRQKVSELKIYVGKFKNGSLLQEISVEIERTGLASQLSFALANFNLDDVFSVAKNAIEFWKILSSSKSEGKNITVNVEEGSFAIVNTGNGNITVGDITFETAKHIMSSGQMLTKPLRNGELDHIELTNGAEPLLLKPEDSNCFSTPIEVAEETKVIIGNIIEFNKDRKTGTVAFIENLKSFHLKFTLADDSSVIETIDSMKKTQCRLVCHEEYILGPNEERNVIRLLVVKIGKV